MIAQNWDEMTSIDLNATVSGNDVEPDLLEIIYSSGIQSENRKSPRKKVKIRVPVTPIDEAGNEIGEPLLLETRDISATGICLLHSEEVLAKYLLLELPKSSSKKQCVVLEVIRCGKINASEGQYEIAGQFVQLPGCQLPVGTREAN